ncbi:protein IQ-DOMAIN 33-like isoform X2 [Aristolochia californica]|uniref:protein IQ-DOMAIN 33-like isoform X2 n=1 Tax=Aristolochia californica TaxID=171875 RepID=UPI0035D7D2C1
MGRTGELVKSVFSKSRSVSAHDGNIKSIAMDKKSWSLVKSYFCVDEVNSVLAEEDSASVRSSEATVTQPIKDEEIHQEIQSESYEEQITEREDVNQARCSQKDDAAIVIQSAFRGFLARRQFQETKRFCKRESSEESKPFTESGGTSVEVETGASTEKYRLQDETAPFHPRVHQKSKTQISKQKEEWNDSTVSSNIAKLRIQHRQEATTRRERALAYAFSQQLRTCTSKKKQAQSDSRQPNLGWSWLERWMATRQPESSVEDLRSNSLRANYSHQASFNTKKKDDVGGEEKESCGSNEITVGLDGVIVNGETSNDGHGASTNRLKAARTVSRRKTVPSCQHTTAPTKVSRKDILREVGKEKQVQQLHMGEK